MALFKSIVRFLGLLVSLAAGSLGLWILATDAMQAIHRQLELLNDLVPMLAMIGMTSIALFLVCLFRIDALLGIVYDFFQGIRWIYAFGLTKKTPLHAPEDERLIDWK